MNRRIWRKNSTLWKHQTMQDTTGISVSGGGMREMISFRCIQAVPQAEFKQSCICIVMKTTYIELIKFQYSLRFSERFYTWASEWKFWKQLFSFRFENFLSLFEMNCRSLPSNSKWDSSCFAISSVTFIKSLFCDFIWQIIQNIIGSIRK